MGYLYLVVVMCIFIVFDRCGGNKCSNYRSFKVRLLVIMRYVLDQQLKKLLVYFIGGSRLVIFSLVGMVIRSVYWSHWVVTPGALVMLDCSVSEWMMKLM